MHGSLNYNIFGVIGTKNTWQSIEVPAKCMRAVMLMYLPEVDIQHSHGDEYGQRNQDHCEEEIFSEQGHGE